MFDDIEFFNRTIGEFAKSSFDFSPRWLTYASLYWTWSLFSDLPYAHRIVNIILHVTCVLLLFYWLYHLITIALRDTTNSETSHLKWGAWLGALFFACNPVAVHAVGYLVQRSILLAGIFTLCMQISYLRGLIGENNVRQHLWLSLSVIFFLLAVLSKEHSLIAPIIIVATTLLLKSYIRVDKRAIGMTLFAYFLIALFIALRVKGVLGDVYEIDAPQLINNFETSRTSTTSLHLLSVLTQAGLFFKYLLLWSLPNPAWMSIDMREPFAQSFSSWQMWAPAIGFILFGAYSFKLLLRGGRTGLIGFALLYPWIFFMVEFSTIRIQETFVLYRSYLWMPGTMLLFPLVLYRLRDAKKIIAALIALTLIFIPLSWNRLWVFADSYRLWNDAALLLPSQTTPGAARIYYNRGNAELAANHWDEAIEDYQKSKSLSPDTAQIYKNTGVAYFSLHKYDLAIQEFDHAIALKPNYADAYFARAVTLKRLNLDNEALANMRKSCSLGSLSACLIVQMSPQNSNPTIKN